MSSGAVAPTPSLQLEGPLELESGGRLPSVTVAYRTWGRLNARGDNAVLVCHALTGSADVDRWWGALLGPGRALDRERDFVVCSNVLGGCYGTTGPTSPRPDGTARWGGDFPAVTVRDIVRVQAALLDALGVRRLRLVLGGSLGGMQALEWALLFPDRVDAIAPIAVSARHSAWCITRAMDTHDVGRGHGGWREALARVRIPALVVSIDTDVLYPPVEQEELAAALPAGRLITLSSPHGHDAFLIEGEATNALVAGFRREVENGNGHEEETWVA